MFVNAGNNFKSRLAVGLNATFDVLFLDGDDGLPDFPFLLTINNNRENMEIVKVTGIDPITTIGLIIERGQEGTEPQNHDAGSLVENNFTAGTYQALVEEIKALKQQSGIVEMGENENGTFEKYGNGLMICRKEFRTSVNNSIGNIYRSDAMVWDYPHIFIDDNVSVNFNCRAVNRWADTSGSIDNISAPFRVYSATRSSDEYTVNATAIGRWK